MPDKSSDRDKLSDLQDIYGSKLPPSLRRGAIRQENAYTQQDRLPDQLETALYADNDALESRKRSRPDRPARQRSYGERLEKPVRSSSKDEGTYMQEKLKPDKERLAHGTVVVEPTSQQHELRGKSSNESMVIRRRRSRPTVAWEDDLEHETQQSSDDSYELVRRARVAEVDGDSVKPGLDSAKTAQRRRNLRKRIGDGQQITERELKIIAEKERLEQELRAVAEKEQAERERTRKQRIEQERRLVEEYEVSKKDTAELEKRLLLEWELKRKEDAEKSEKGKQFEKETEAYRQKYASRHLIFPKIHRSYIMIETLDHFNLPWEYDRFHLDYYIVLREMEQSEINVLFAHTDMLRIQQSLAWGEKPPFRFKFTRREFAISSRYDEPSTVVFFEQPPLRRIYEPSPPSLVQLRDFEQEGVNYDTAPSTALWFNRLYGDPLDDPQASSENASQSSTVRRGVLVFDDGDSASSLDQSTDDTRASSHRARMRDRVVRSKSDSQSDKNSPMLKRIVYATFGDIANADRPDAYRSTAGFVALPSKNSPPSFPQYSFMHIQQGRLDLENFKEQVINLPQLRGIVPDLEYHFDRVDQLHDSHSGWFIEITAIGDSIGNTIMSICIPYVHLTEHQHERDIKHAMFQAIKRFSSKNPHARKKETSPGMSRHTRTLLQTLNPGITSRRDIKQAVCQLLDPRDRRYLCLSQVWLLVINQELIISCSGFSEDELYGDLLKATPKPNFHPVSVQTPDNRTWFLQQEDCLTYLDFASHFSGITVRFAETFAVYMDEEEIFPHAWPRLMERARNSAVHLVVKKRPDTFKDLLRGYREMPDATNLYNEIGTKWFPRKGFAQSLSKQQVEEVKIRGTEVSDHGSEPENTKDETKDTEDDDIDYEDDSDDDKPANNFKAEPAPRMILPSTLLTKDVLVRLGIQFRKRDEWYEFLSRPEFEKALSSLNDLGKEGLRAIVYRNLTSSDEKLEKSDGASSLSIPSTVPPSINIDSPASGEPAADSGLFLDEDKLYRTCSRMTEISFEQQLLAWHLGAVQQEEQSSVSLAGDEIDELCHILGSLPLFDHESELSELGAVPVDGWLYANTLNGLRDLQSLCFSGPVDHELRSEQEKLRSAIFDLIDTYHQPLEPIVKTSGIVVLRQMTKHFLRFFNVIQELRLYSVTLQVMMETGDMRVNDVCKIMRHITLALLIATRSIFELDENLSTLKDEIVRRKSKLDVIGPVWLGSFAYKRIAAHGRRMASVMESGYYGDGLEGEKRRTEKMFNRSVDKLVSQGWGQDATRSILRNEYRWRRVTFHLDHASRALRNGFLATLTAKVGSKIENKAAAFPTDLVILLLSQLLSRPLSRPDFGEADVMEMYFNYATKLETETLTGDPTRESLDRIRYFRHELNAFSQVHEMQMGLLSNISRILTRRDLELDAGGEMDDDPFPRRRLLATMMRNAEIHGAGPQAINNQLSYLQREALAQIEGIQDWRDNAVVVFTIITIIFLPMSFVASVFGMNTSDVRNMPLNQWVFWTSAAPFTALVIIITLYFVDVPPLRRWLEQKGWRDGERDVAVEGNIAMPVPMIGLMNAKGSSSYKVLRDLAKVMERERDRDKRALKAEKNEGWSDEDE